MSARWAFDGSAERYFAGFSGVVLLAEDPRFEGARRVWNGMIDRTPALIACCRDTLDVTAAIGFARETGRALSVRCGGHNVAGSAVADDAVMIDLSLMRLADLCDEAVARLIASSARNPSATGSIDVECLRGAVLRGGTSESAFPQREAPFMVTVSGSWDDPGLDQEGIAWAREAIDSVRAWEHPGAYANYISDQEGPLEASAMYGSAIYSRLAQVKRAYDPDTMFRSARGISPAAPR